MIGILGFDKFIKWVDQYGEKISLLHVVILSFLLALFSVIYMDGGFLNREQYVRLPFYMSDIPLLKKIFDSRILDDGCYRAREISYFLDVIDYKFVQFSVEAGFPHFLSLTHYTLSIATGCVLWLFCAKELNLHPMLGVGWLILFWTSPCIFFNSLNRTGKIWTTFLTAILFYLIYKIVVTPLSEKIDFRSPAKKNFISFFLIMFMMTFLDEQGTFLMFAALIFLFMWNFLIHNKNIYMILLIGAVLVFFHGFYRYLIAPELTLMINGYRPDFAFQSIPFLYFVQHLPMLFLSGLSLYLDTLRFLVGNPPVWVMYGLLFLFLLFSAYYLRNVSDDNRKIFIPAFIGLLTIHLLIVLMHALMILKLPGLFSPALRRVYHWSPTLIVLAMTLAILTHIVCKAHVPKWLIIITMCVAVMGNIIALPQHKSILSQAHWKTYIGPSRVLLSALKDIQSFKNTNDPLIKANPIFQLFLSEKKNTHDVGDLYNARGIFLTYLLLHQYAVEDFYVAIGLKQAHLNATNRIVTYHELNRYGQVTANDDNDENVGRLKQNYAEAYNDRGVDASNHGEQELAIRFFSEAILLNPKFVFAYHNRAMLHFAEGDEKRGCMDASRACLLKHCKVLEVAKGKGLCD